MENSDQLVKQFVSDITFYNWVHRLNDRDVQYWEKQLAERPEWKSAADEAASLLSDFRAVKKPLPDQQVQEQWKKLEAKILNQKSTESGNNPFAFNKWPYWAAASIVVLLTGAFLTNQLFFNTSGPQEISTSSGEVVSYTFYDASQVTLNGNSNIRFQESVWEDRKIREVWLEGEAYFEIEQTADSIPFYVHTQALTVEVLGTSFNVSGRDDHTEVVLNTGKIQLRTREKQQKTLKMMPGDYVNYSLDDQVFHQKQVNPMLHYTWKDKRLIFNKTPLGQVGDILENTYGLHIIFENESDKLKTVDGDILDVTPDKLIEVIKAYYQDLSFTKRHDTLWIE